MNSENLNIEETIILNFLKKLYSEKLKKEEYKIINNKKYVILPVEYLLTKYNISAFRQRGMLNRFQDLNLLSVKLGQCRRRYFSFQDNDCFEIINLQKEIKKTILKLNNVKQLNKILTYIKEISGTAKRYS